jgi:hypothetical protein
LGIGIHLGAILLVDKNDRYELGPGEKGRVGVGDDAFAEVTEEQAAKHHAFGLAKGGSEGVLTRVHGKKESTDDDIRGRHGCTCWPGRSAMG